MKFYWLSDATFYDYINTIYISLLNISQMKKKMSIFKENGAFKRQAKSAADSFFFFFFFQRK